MDKGRDGFGMGRHKGVSVTGFEEWKVNVTSFSSPKVALSLIPAVSQYTDQISLQRFDVSIRCIELYNTDTEHELNCSFTC
jgi:hypothetical protein